MKTCLMYTKARIHYFMRIHIHIQYTHMVYNNKTQTNRSNSDKCKLNLNDSHCKFESQKSIEFCLYIYNNTKVYWNVSATYTVEWTCIVSPPEFTTRHQTDVSATHIQYKQYGEIILSSRCKHASDHIKQP